MTPHRPSLLVRVAMMPRVCLLLALIAVVALLLLNPVSAQSFGSKAAKASADRKDLPLISCSVCTSVSYVLYDFAQQMHQEVNDANEQRKLVKSRNTAIRRLDENMLIEVLEGVCKPESVHGEWMRHLDIVEIDTIQPDKSPTGEYKKLALEWHETEGKCGNECHTIALSCSKLQNELDLDELQSLLYSFKLSRDDIQGRICKKLSARCRTEDKSYLADSVVRNNEAFHEMSDKDIEMEKLMEQMKAMGMSGNAYARDDMDAMAASMANDGYGDGDGEGDRDDRDMYGMPDIGEGRGEAGAQGGFGGFDGSFGDGAGFEL